MAAGSDCKLLIAALESERHPDLAIYKTTRPRGVEDYWAVWVPEIVVEIVSPSSSRRDYDEKPEEYLRFGVREYWIVDADREVFTVLRRRGQRWIESTYGPADVYRTRLLPGFEFRCDLVFAAARSAED
jgi:Uma2 family endonuclease